MKKSLFLLCLLFINCAGDIKGAPGADALTNPLVRIARPSFYSLTDTVIAVDGSTTNPALFKFGSEILTAPSSLLCDITTNGIGGLRSGVTLGSDEIYYLYGVKNGETPGLIADTNEPSVGPEGFTEWTYIGAFPINSTQLTAFTSTKGRLLTTFYVGNQPINNAAPAQPVNLIIPTTASAVYLRSFFSAPAVAGQDLVIGPTSTSSITINQATGTTQNPITFTWIPIVEPKKIYAYVTPAATDIAQITISGWDENPLDFK